MTLYFKDSSATYDASLKLRRNNMDRTYTDMGVISSSGISGDNQQLIDYTINPGIIDNSQYSYYLYWSGNITVHIHGVVIEYTFTEPN